MYCIIVVLWYDDSEYNTADENSSIFSLILVAVSEVMHYNLARTKSSTLKNLLKWWCWLAEADLRNSCKMVVYVHYCCMMYYSKCSYSYNYLKKTTYVNIMTSHLAPDEIMVKILLGEKSFQPIAWL